MKRQLASRGLWLMLIMTPLFAGCGDVVGVAADMAGAPLPVSLGASLATDALLDAAREDGRESHDYEADCQRGDPEGCYLAAGEAVQRGEYDAAMALAGEGCAGGLADSCEFYWLLVAEKGGTQ